MTEQTMTRQAGNALDAEIAVVVFGRRHLVGADVPALFIHAGEPFGAQEVWVGEGDSDYWCRACGSLPSFSTDLAAAWLVVEKLRARRIGEAEMRHVFFLAHCYTASEVAAAICRAALAVALPHPEPAPDA